MGSGRESKYGLGRAEAIDQPSDGVNNAPLSCCSLCSVYAVCAAECPPVLRQHSDMTWQTGAGRPGPAPGTERYSLQGSFSVCSEWDECLRLLVIVENH